MIRSMTGYGRAQQVVDSMCISVEIKSVNHRFFDFSSRTPRTYGFLDEKLKHYIQPKVTRGKVECSVFIENLEDSGCCVEVNQSLAKGYIDALRLISGKYGVKDDVSACAVSRFPDVLVVTKSPADEDKMWNNVKVVLDEALDSFISMRQKEGESLRVDILSRCDTILNDVSYIEERSPQTVAEYNAKLLERMRTVLEDVQVDEQRLLTEAAIYADKVAVAEETVRLRSHVAQMREFMNAEEAIGKKTDFLVQEFNREANTIGSKCQDVDISKKVINIKAEIEKIREQVQNIE